MWLQPRHNRIIYIWLICFVFIHDSPCLGLNNWLFSAPQDFLNSGYFQEGLENLKHKEKLHKYNWFISCSTKTYYHHHCWTSGYLNMQKNMQKKMQTLGTLYRNPFTSYQIACFKVSSFVSDNAPSSMEQRAEIPDLRWVCCWFVWPSDSPHLCASPLPLCGLKITILPPFHCGNFQSKTA